MSGEAGDVAHRAPTPSRAADASSDPVRVVIVDDHDVVRDGLVLVLSREAGISVVAEAGDAATCFAAVAEHQPDVVILDLTLGDNDGIPLLRELAARHEAAILILTMHQDPETVRQALLAGAAGYVVKGARSAELVDAVRAVARGDRYVHSSVAGIVVEDSVRWLRERNTLSEREREVLGLVAAGMTAAMVADRLGISIHTVHRHVSNISAKNGTRGLPALIRYAVEHGLVRGPDAPGAADA